jgi:hypothetical protein
LVESQPLHAWLVHVCPEGQVWQFTPPVPQTLVSVPGWHIPLKQHPVGQVVALHTQLPATDACPGAQAGLGPHAQAPPVQELASVGEHAAHTSPGRPQLAALGATHTPFSQQPAGQLVASQPHTPPTHACPEGQGAPVPQVHAPAVQRSVLMVRQLVQTWPALPHAESSGVLQKPPKQQPAHEVESHPLQLPPRQ